MTDHQLDWLSNQPEPEKPKRPEFALGRHECISNEDYHASTGYSNSFLTALLRSPDHAVSRKAWKSTRNMEIGSAFHCSTLEPENYAKEYRTIECDVRTSTLYKQAVKDYPAELVLTAPEAETVKGMTAGVYKNPKLREIITLPGKAEVAYFAIDPVTGLLIKCKFDWLTDCGISLDIKKTQDARRHAFSRSINAYRYDMQDAFYRFVYKCATGEDLKQFYFGAVEEMSPHASHRWKLGQETREHGDRLFREALNTLAICLDRGQFPAYPEEDDDEIDVPHWVFEENDAVDLDGLEEV